MRAVLLDLQYSFRRAPEPHVDPGVEAEVTEEREPLSAENPLL